MLHGDDAIYLSKFQFHSGSIKSVRLHVSLESWGCFNSIVVRLKDRNSSSPMCNKRSFNSIVVRLKEILRFEALTKKPRFNSIVVRLKGEDVGAEIIRISEFQFHSGSIKSAQGRVAQRPTVQFQFHSGSIKRLMGFPDDHIVSEFQFHSGSIKRSIANVPTISQTKFQFHSGSIKRRLPTRFSNRKPACFNSIVVRLKVGDRI